MQTVHVQVKELLISIHNQFERMAKTMVVEISQLGSRIKALEKQVEALTEGGISDN
jgi:hypothetical protein